MNRIIAVDICKYIDIMNHKYQNILRSHFPNAHVLEFCLVDIIIVQVMN